MEKKFDIQITPLIISKIAKKTKKIMQIQRISRDSCQQKTIILQMTNSSAAFTQFLEKVSSDDTIPQAILKAQEKYNIKAYEASKLNPAQALKLYECIYSKFYKEDNHHITQNWFQNELRLFVWVAICYCHLKGLQVQQLVHLALKQGNQDWSYLTTIFDHKDPKLLQYQCHCFYLKNRGAIWQQKEENQLKQIIQQGMSGNNRHKIKWNQISKLLFHRSNKQFLRTPKQCRQRWNNHLDPSKIKGMWKKQQCLQMFQYVRTYGKKWAALVKVFKNTRNQHSIKNKFNSLYKKQTKSIKNQNYTQQQIYDQIIARIKSAIENQKYSKKTVAHAGDFDFDDDQDAEIQNQPSHSQGKPSFYVQKIMQKLKCFGAPENQAKKVKQQNDAEQKQKQKANSIRYMKSATNIETPKLQQRVSLSIGSEEGSEQENEEDSQFEQEYSPSPRSRNMMRERKIEDKGQQQQLDRVVDLMFDRDPEEMQKNQRFFI